MKIVPSEVSKSLCESVQVNAFVDVYVVCNVNG